MMQSTANSVLATLARAYPAGVPIRKAFRQNEWNEDNNHCRTIMSELIGEELAILENKSELVCTRMGFEVSNTGGLISHRLRKEDAAKKEIEEKDLRIEEARSNIEFAQKSLKIAEEANKLAAIANTLSEKANEKADIANAQSEAAEGRARRSNQIAIAAAIIAALATLISIFKN